ncbi:MAG: hypothetical protein LUG99_10870 [Lachnospiraceae bacterium]|nr:hypothetical protein [Lachnospiraceae bacterium]
MKDGRMLIVPLDDSLIFGPYDGLQSLAGTVTSICKSNPSAILGYKGTCSLIENPDIPFILNITASTTMGNHVQKVVSESVADALTIGADCIAVHVNYTGLAENEMLKQLSEIIGEADQYGMPVLAISYPRKSVKGQDYNYEDIKKSDTWEYARIICHCVRASVELGADVIKTQYTGNTESFKMVVSAAMGRPVVIAGGPLIEVSDSYRMAREALDAGASGISYGRNIFNAENIGAYLLGLKEIVFHDADVNEALSIYKGGLENV